MPLLKGKNVSRNIDEMAHSANHKKRVREHGAKKANEMEVAAAMRTADPSGMKLKREHKHRMGG